MLLSSGPGSRFSGQALPRRSRGPSPFGVWGTFPFLSLSLAPNHRGKKKKIWSHLQAKPVRLREHSPSSWGRRTLLGL